MIKRSFIIKSETGLHARPVTIFINKSKSFDSDIKVIKDTKIADGKKFLQVLSLGVLENDSIFIEIDGNDEKEAMYALEKLIVNDFKE
ncbi:hypothetical protein SH1V18_09750 [Vallitalea longa]|uniref:HPr domain-containing protein n=1 Tax=Vallitalea longa TaxID=2936439 RepID=A0A9W5Y7P7_9FIRM|nr:HPr family phosphocarrier protein [Vallitalea longa]GKX28495.1 hypothetical protein SH1V18_09750 [Vallitalea longa]